MLFWTLQITIISIILIFLVHNLIGFFKSTLTVPKIKDLVNAPVQKYENIFNVLSNSNAGSSSSSSGSSSGSSNAYLPPLEPDLKPNVASMKNELKSFLKNKLKGGASNDGTRNTTSIASLDSATSNSLSYSAY
jgi:hypothetical protein